MRLVWTTDPHLNHVPVDQQDRWVAQIASHGADGVVISGDISEGDDVVFQLQRFAQTFESPIYFVLGNHDFYQSSISVTRQRVIAISREEPRLCYLTDTSPIELHSGTFLVGDDGWGDATVGDYDHSSVLLNDFVLIQDFHEADPAHWRQQLVELGAESAQRLAVKLDTIPLDARQVLVVTHVPPFREACWYKGETTDKNWAPYFVCGQVGNVLKVASQTRPHCQFTVLCGHTHHGGVARLSDNLIVHTGAAVYGEPKIERMVSISDDAIELISV